MTVGRRLAQVGAPIAAVVLIAGLRDLASNSSSASRTGPRPRPRRGHTHSHTDADGDRAADGRTHAEHRLRPPPDRCHRTDTGPRTRTAR